MSYLTEKFTPEQMMAMEQAAQLMRDTGLKVSPEMLHLIPRLHVYACAVATVDEYLEDEIGCCSDREVYESGGKYNNAIHWLGTITSEIGQALKKAGVEEVIEVFENEYEEEEEEEE
jgi:hypothetical protein